MTTRYVCADCEREFTTEDTGDDPRCPECSRTEAVEPADTASLQSDIWRQWLVVFALLLAAGIAYLVYE
jgi:hypothetical protein